MVAVCSSNDRCSIVVADMDLSAFAAVVSVVIGVASSPWPPYCCCVFIGGACLGQRGICSRFPYGIAVVVVVVVVIAISVSVGHRHRRCSYWCRSCFVVVVVVDS